MLTRGLVAGALLAAVATGCAAFVPAVPLVVKPADQISIINLKLVQSTIDKSLQDTVAISFVPPRAFAVESIEYSMNGRKVAQGEFDLILETDRLKVGEHIVNLYAKGDGNIVQGTTQLTIIESGLEPGTEQEGDPSGTGAGSDAASQASNPGSKAGSQTSTSKSKQPPSGSWDNANLKARVAIKIRLPDE
jgi:hypothetical protein